MTDRLKQIKAVYNESRRTSPDARLSEHGHALARVNNGFLDTVIYLINRLEAAELKIAHDAAWPDDQGADPEARQAWRASKIVLDNRWEQSK